MNELDQSSCEACTSDSSMVNNEEQMALMKLISGWHIVSPDDIERLQKSFKFSNFKNALSFTNIIGRIAEHHNHHPEIVTEWGRVTISWWTHSVHGLHRNDFIMAAKTDEEYKHFTPGVNV